MNGAEALISNLNNAGVEVCFANPGTSEMQLVAAIDQQDGMRAILCLFEGVVTGAADGYGRMADKPALTLLHLGPGLGNGTANLHNAKRAGSPVLNMVGDHATYHLEYDAPLTADIIGFASPVSHWVGTSTSADNLAQCGIEALGEAMQYPGRVATFIAPANHAWDSAQSANITFNPPSSRTAADTTINAAKLALTIDGETTLYLGGRALREDALEQAGRIAAATGCRLVCETFCSRLHRGAGRVPVERLPYFGEQAADFIANTKALVCVGAKPPVSFFAYPDKPSWLTPEGAQVVQLTESGEDCLDALQRLADALSAPTEVTARQARFIPDYEQGPLNAVNTGAVLAELIPENAIISDEAATCGLFLFGATAGAAKHDWLMLTGGAIGQGLPVAVGAAVACPERTVLALQADGSGMYTPQALWTMAREQLDVVTIIFNNGSYAILNIELARVGVSEPGPKALSLLDLKNPPLDWVALAQGMGIRASRVSTTDELHDALQTALAQSGPVLIEAMV